MKISWAFIMIFRGKLAVFTSQSGKNSNPRQKKELQISFSQYGKTNNSWLMKLVPVNNKLEPVYQRLSGGRIPAKVQIILGALTSTSCTVKEAIFPCEKKKKLRNTCNILSLHARVTGYDTHTCPAEPAKCTKNNVTPPYS